MSANHKLIVSLSPHEKGSDTTQKIMWTVAIALLPALLAGTWVFGLAALKVTLLAVIFCVGLEYLVQKYMLKTEVTVTDGSAAVTGMLLAFNVPAGIPWWQLLVGAIAAIGIAKMAFGGLGRNPLNPALIGRAFMLASFPVHMTSWPVPMQNLLSLGVDGKTSATALGMLKEAKTGVEAIGLPSHMDLFLGAVGGCIGEISALAILIGGIFLLVRRVITWHIPIFYLFSLFAFTGVLWLLNPARFADPLFHLLAGGAMLGAWFMATDMVTSPMTIKGQIVFAVLGGVLCGAIRLFGAYPEGCSYSILIMNAFVPLIDKVMKPKAFGKEVNYVGQ
jgi:electron transport complex protein RnfD